MLIYNRISFVLKILAAQNRFNSLYDEIHKKKDIYPLIYVMFRNVTAILEDLLHNYDKTERPSYNNGKYFFFEVLWNVV